MMSSTEDTDTQQPLFRNQNADKSIQRMHESYQKYFGFYNTYTRAFQDFL